MEKLPALGYSESVVSLVRCISFMWDHFTSFAIHNELDCLAKSLGEKQGSQLQSRGLSTAKPKDEQWKQVLGYKHTEECH